MDPKVKTNVLRKMTCGIWVMAADHAGDRAAATVSWLSQVSFTPPLIATALRVDSRIHKVVKAGRTFSLHLVTAAKKDVAQAFFRPPEITADRIGGLAYSKGAATGAPILEGFPCWIEARVTDTVSRGDHELFVAEVLGVGQTDAEAVPLTLAASGWNYGG